MVTLQNNKILKNRSRNIKYLCFITFNGHVMQRWQWHGLETGFKHWTAQLLLSKSFPVPHQLLSHTHTHIPLLTPAHCSAMVSDQHGHPWKSQEFCFAKCQCRFRAPGQAGCCPTSYHTFGVLPSHHCGQGGLQEPQKGWRSHGSPAW